MVCFRTPWRGPCREMQVARGDVQKKQHGAEGTNYNLILEEAAFPRIRHRVYSWKLVEFYPRSFLASDAAVDPQPPKPGAGIWQHVFRLASTISKILPLNVNALYGLWRFLSTISLTIPLNSRPLVWSWKVFEQNCSVLFSRSQRRWWFNSAHLGFQVVELTAKAESSAGQQVWGLSGWEARHSLCASQSDVSTRQQVSSRPPLIQGSSQERNMKGLAKVNRYPLPVSPELKFRTHCPKLETENLKLWVPWKLHGLGALKLSGAQPMSTRGEKRKKELESHALSGRVRHVFRVFAYKLGSGLLSPWRSPQMILDFLQAPENVYSQRSGQV